MQALNIDSSTRCFRVACFRLLGCLAMVACGASEAHVSAAVAAIQVHEQTCLVAVHEGDCNAAQRAAQDGCAVDGAGADGARRCRELRRMATACRPEEGSDHGH